MRSAWSLARSRSFDTLLEVFANCWLALPTAFASDFGSRSEKRGSFTPRTVLRLMRCLSATPPAIPAAAAAPAATAGPFARLAACMIVPIAPFLPLLLAFDRFASLDPPEPLRACGVRVALLREPLAVRDELALLRVAADRLFALPPEREDLPVPDFAVERFALLFVRFPPLLLPAIRPNLLVRERATSGSGLPA